MNDPELLVGDCLCPNWIRVDAYQRYRDVAHTAHSRIFAVFSEDGNALGLVNERQAALFPERIFGDLLLRRLPLHVVADAPLMDVLSRMESEGEEYFIVVDDADIFVGVVSRLSIITALIARERSLREDMEHLLVDYRNELENRRITAAVFDSTSEGIVVTDAQERIIIVNRAFSETTGWTMDEVVGQSPRLLHSGKHDNAFYEQMWKAIRETGGWDGEIWNRRKNGEIYPEWLHINAIHGDDGQVGYYAGIFSDATYQEELRLRLHYLAYHDALTGLPNRQLFLDRLEQGIALAHRTNEVLALLFIDVDNFKEVNDTLGHVIGDRLLCEVGEVLRATVREDDTVARLGGDEFTVITRIHDDGEGLAAVAGKILNALNRPFKVDDHELFVSVSIGISCYPHDGNNPEQLLMNSDSAMYQAKEAGKGQFHTYSATGHYDFVERVRLSTGLRQALMENAITVAWQPQVEATTGRVVGMEALARWTDQEGKAIPPDTFVSVAEQTGLIGQLGKRMLRAAASEAAALLAEGFCTDKSVRFAVNVSPFQVHAGGQGEDVITGADSILSVLEDCGLDPMRLELELTESAIASHRAGMHDILLNLGRSGIQIAIDDFGIGCSNLLAIRRLPVHKIKLDRLLVTDLDQNFTDREIVAAVLGMARALNLHVVAEGVETKEQAAVLDTLGCNIAQGYLYARPMPMVELREWLGRSDTHATHTC